MVEKTVQKIITRTRKNTGKAEGQHEVSKVYDRARQSGIRL